jgi:hypothetical protein
MVKFLFQELEAREDNQCDDKPNRSLDQPGRLASAPCKHCIEPGEKILRDKIPVDERLGARALEVDRHLDSDAVSLGLELPRPVWPKAPMAQHQYTVNKVLLAPEVAALDGGFVLSVGSEAKRCSWHGGLATSNGQMPILAEPALPIALSLPKGLRLSNGAPVPCTWHFDKLSANGVIREAIPGQVLAGCSHLSGSAAPAVKPG